LKTIRQSTSVRLAPTGEIAGLRARLAEAEGTLRAIRTGEVDTVMVAGIPDSKVLMLSAHSDNAYADTAIMSEAVGFLRKQISNDCLRFVRTLYPVSDSEFKT